MKSIATPFRRGARAASALAGLALGLSTSSVEAQPRPAQPAAPAAQPAAPAAQPAAPAAQPAAPAAQPAEPVRAPDSLGAALAARPGGLTPEEVARAAARTNPSLRARQADLAAAAARVDQAFVNYFPRLTVTATYARLSDVENEIPASQGGTVATGAPGPVTVGPCPGNPAANCLLDSAGNPAVSIPASATTSALASLFEPRLNAYSFTAALAVPISDYVFRISQGYAAASHAESASRLQAQAAELQVAADAKIAFYNWVRAKGQVVVAHEAVEQARAHVADARRTFDVGLISRADVLRLEAQVASAEQLETEARGFLAVTDEQLRIALGAPPERTLEIGIDVMAAPSQPPSASLQALQQEAFQKRLEIRALDETEYSLKEVESVARAGYLPRIDGFANLNYAMPNTRFTLEPDEFNLSWDVGVRLSWTINDTFTASGATAEARARTQAVAEQKAALRDGLRLEVASAYTDVMKATANIAAAERQLAASEESMRVRLELFRAGRATSVDVVDAETEVTRARLRQIDARVGLLVARTRLEHATGRDVK